MRPPEGRGQDAWIQTRGATVSDEQRPDPERPPQDDDVPDTPPTEPPPVPVDDPPSEPGPGGPYVVTQEAEEESRGRSA